MDLIGASVAHQSLQRVAGDRRQLLRWLLLELHQRGCLVLPDGAGSLDELDLDRVDAAALLARLDGHIEISGKTLPFALCFH